MTGETSFVVFVRHFLALGLQKALVGSITIKVLQAISSRPAALAVPANQSVQAVGQQRGAELSADTAVAPPPSPRAKDGHTRSSASAFLAFLEACHICASQSDWPEPANTARARVNTYMLTCTSSSKRSRGDRARRREGSGVVIQRGKGGS